MPFGGRTGRLTVIRDVLIPSQEINYRLKVELFANRRGIEEEELILFFLKPTARCTPGE